MILSGILNQDEGKTLEFKRDLSSPRNILKTMVAFANTAGGLILIGVEDGSRKPIGVSNPLDEEERLCNLTADQIEPRLLPDIEFVSWEDKTLLAVEVFPSPLRPHFLKPLGPAGVFVRLGSTNRRADDEMIAEIRRSGTGMTLFSRSWGSSSNGAAAFGGCFRKPNPSACQRPGLMRSA